MDGAATDDQALFEAAEFLDHLPDLRQRGKVTYPLEEVLRLGAARGVGRSRILRRDCLLWREEA